MLDHNLLLLLLRRRLVLVSTNAEDA